MINCCKDMENFLDLAFTSSSEEDHELEDYEFIVGTECRCHYRIRIPKVQYFIETVVDAYNAEDFRRAFR